MRKTTLPLILISIASLGACTSNDPHQTSRPYGGTAGIRVKFIKKSCNWLIFKELLLRNLAIYGLSLEKV